MCKTNSISDDDTRIIVHNILENEKTPSINSYNDLHDNLPELIKNGFKLSNCEQIKGTDTYRRYSLRFTNVTLVNPSVIDKNDPNKLTTLYPRRSIEDNIPYRVKIKVRGVISASEFTKKDKEEVIQKSFDYSFENSVGHIPTLFGSKSCSTNSLTLEDKRKAGMIEGCDGMTSLGGGLKVFLGIRSGSKNMPQEKIYYDKSSGSNKVSYWMTRFISQDKDDFQNSTQIEIKLMNVKPTPLLYLEITLGYGTDVLKIPFFALFNAFGMFDTRDILKLVMTNTQSTDETSCKIREIVNASLDYKNYPEEKFHALSGLSQTETILTILKMRYITEKLAKQTKADNFGFKGQLMDNPIDTISSDDKEEYIKNFYAIFDKNLLKNEGTSSSTRIKKLNYLGYLVKRTLNLYFDPSLVTDTTTIENETVDFAGDCLIRLIKQIFNTSVVQIIRIAANGQIDDPGVPFKKYCQELQKAVDNPTIIRKFDDAIEKVFNSPNREVPIGEYSKVTKRLVLQEAKPEGPSNKVGQTRLLTRPQENASSQPGQILRQKEVKPGSTMFIDSNMSAEGKGTGKNGQITLLTMCTRVSSFDKYIFYLSKTIHEDPRVIKIRDEKFPGLDIRITPQSELDDISGYTEVICCGNCIGYIKNAFDYYELLLILKRKQIGLHNAASITMGRNRDIVIATGAGILYKPIFVVHNNLKEIQTKDASKFRQWIGVTQDDLEQVWKNHQNGDKIAYQFLLDRGDMEYVTSKSVDNYYVCPSIHEFNENLTNIEKAYRYVEIPVSCIGYNVAQTPRGNYAETVRTMFAQKLSSQAIGQPFYSGMPNGLKNVYTLLYKDHTIINSTIVSKYVETYGQQCVVAVMGRKHNQEDSMEIRAGSFGRGLNICVKYSTIEINVYKNERIGIPTENQAYPDKNYSNLDKGYPVLHTKYYKDDAILGKIKTTTNREVCSSHIHSSKHPIYVISYNVINPLEKDYKIVKIKYCKWIPTQEGDKFASRCGNKGVVSKSTKDSMIPYTESGTIPDMIINPHCLPSRKTVNQVIAGCNGKLAIDKHGKPLDCTMFSSFNMEEMAYKMACIGLDYRGTEDMYNPETGQKYEVGIYVGVQGINKLTKLAVDNNNAVNSVEFSQTTGQPNKGYTRDAGTKLGEMEIFCLLINNALSILMAIALNNSDGCDRYVCGKCRRYADINPEKNIYMCGRCKDNVDEFIYMPTTENSMWIARALECLHIRLIPLFEGDKCLKEAKETGRLKQFPIDDFC